MSETPLTPQEPGDVPAVDNGKIDGLAEGNVGDLVESLDALEDLEIEQLLAAEKRGKNRSTALAAIQREQERRKVDAENPAPGTDTDVSPIGDDASYAHMRAAEIDPAKLQRPVLSRDGWVLPLPRATGEG